MSIPGDLQYTEEHEWTKSVDGGLNVGITDYAQQELGDVVYVELPEVGAKVSKGESFATVESVKAVSEIYSPIDGEIIAVNQELADAPESINQEPYGAGWMVTISPSDSSQLEALMSADAYTAFIAEVSK
jgi:glycine cleavage system H protein